MTVPHLRWVEYRGKDTPRSRDVKLRCLDLHLGALPDPVAGLSLSSGGKRYFAQCLLPGAEVPDHAVPLDEGKRLVQAAVESWFAAAAGLPGEGEGRAEG